jgi:hypothetical protein
MSPDNEPLDPIPIDPPDNTSPSADADPDASDAQALAIDPPDNT